jgi:hypothetical protein
VRLIAIGAGAASEGNRLAERLLPGDPPDGFRFVGRIRWRLFLYFEDTDLCWRARRAGYRIGWLQQYEVLHHGCGSQSGVSEYEQARTLFAGGLTIPPNPLARADRIIK